MNNKSTFSILFVAQKGKLKANGKAPILARVTVNGEMVHLATRLDVDPDRWLGKECRTLGKSAEDKYINEALDNYRNVIRNKYNELFFRGEAITAMRLKSILTSRSDEAKRLLVLFDEFNEDYKALVGKETTHKTYTRYLLARRRLAEFMAAKYKVKDILLTDINTKFINDFYIYLRTVDGKNGHNYHMKMIQRFRTVFKTAKDNGWVQTDPFGGFKISMEETHREHLTIDELGALMSKEMTSERLQRVKDIFVFSCFTGLAYTDVRGLKKSEVVMGNDGRLWIDTRRDKTKVAVYVPLLDIPRAILERYADTTSHDRLLSIPANQKVNDYLKEIAAICGIDKNLTFHTARHTFATMMLTLGADLYTTSKLLGHADVKMTQVYAKIINQKKDDAVNLVNGLFD